jgi:hypothetical protein
MGVVAYKVGTEGGQPQLVLVESRNAVASVPRLASVSEVEKAATDIGEALVPVRALAERLIDAFRAARPSELTVEFGVELGGKAGIPFVTEGSASANFKVQLTWKAAPGGEAGK